MTHITDYGGAIDDYYPARIERIADMTDKEKVDQMRDARWKPSVIYWREQYQAEKERADGLEQKLKEAIQEQEEMYKMEVALRGYVK